MIIIPGKPIAKKRPRFARRGKFVVTYSDQETEEGKVLFHIQQQWKEAPITGPITLKLFFAMPVPDSTSNKKKVAMIQDEIHHVKKPDLDNLIKFVKDCGNEIIWKDDSQIIELSAKKFYGENPSTVILLKRM